MNVIDAINNRYSCRDFEDKEVEKEKIEKIIKTALRTPSWANSQPWEVYVAGYETSKKIREIWTSSNTNKGRSFLELGNAGGWTPEISKRMEELWPDMEAHCEHGLVDFSILNRNLFNAPCIIYICMDKNLTAWSVWDCGAFSQSIMLAAKEYDLETIPAIAYVTFPDVVRREMEIPENEMIMLGIGIGYPKNNKLNTLKTQRKDLSEVVFKD